MKDKDDQRKKKAKSVRIKIEKIYDLLTEPGPIMAKEEYDLILDDKKKILNEKMALTEMPKAQSFKRSL